MTIDRFERMDFTPKYPQPFTFERAMEMDVSLINDG
jgi:hypothetical protein